MTLRSSHLIDSWAMDGLMARERGSDCEAEENRSAGDDSQHLLILNDEDFNILSCYYGS
jgi:hypothetical protein